MVAKQGGVDGCGGRARKDDGMMAERGNVMVAEGERGKVMADGGRAR